MRPKKTALKKKIRTLNIFMVTMQHFLLQKPLQELDLSESFKEMAYCHHFKTLSDILNWPVGVLLMHEGFTYHHYQELRNILSPINGTHLLKTATL